MHKIPVGLSPKRRRSSACVVREFPGLRARGDRRDVLRRVSTSAREARTEGRLEVGNER